MCDFLEPHYLTALRCRAVFGHVVPSYGWFSRWSIARSIIVGCDVIARTASHRVRLSLSCFLSHSVLFVAAPDIAVETGVAMSFRLPNGALGTGTHDAHLHEPQLRGGPLCSDACE